MVEGAINYKKLYETERDMLANLKKELPKPEYERMYREAQTLVREYKLKEAVEKLIILGIPPTKRDETYGLLKGLMSVR